MAGALAGLGGPGLQQVDVLRKGNEQMRREKQIPRMKVSESVKAIIKFCEENVSQDPILMGIPNSENPFIPKSKPCALLWGLVLF